MATTFEQLRAAQKKLIRKAQGGVILVGPTEAEVPEKFFTDAEGTFTDLKALGYQSLGWFSKSDGVNFTRERETSEVESFGASEATRIDITKDATSAAFVCQETNRQVLELFHGVDLSEVVPDENGELSFNNPDIPKAIYKRLIYIAKDDILGEDGYVIKTMPSGMISETSDQGWSNEDAITSGLTVKATRDDELGYAVRHTFGGPGFAKIYEDMGFNLA